MTLVFWLGVAVIVIGLFMLVAGIGPYIWIPIAVILVGIGVAVLGKVRPRR